jgi:hypothetical protein
LTGILFPEAPPGALGLALFYRFPETLQEIESPRTTFLGSGVEPVGLIAPIPWIRLAENPFACRGLLFVINVTPARKAVN